MRGQAPPAPLVTAIESIFLVDPPDTPTVYGGAGRLAIGLELIPRHLGRRPSEDEMPVVRYALGIVHLERKLVRSRELMDRLADGVARIRRQAEHFSSTHENVIAALADLYQATVSTLSPRIIVTGGEHGYLAQESRAAQVRALLLAAMRSAVLWRQNGGTRPQLLFRRRQIVDTANRLRQLAAAS